MASLDELGGAIGLVCIAVEGPDVTGCRVNEDAEFGAMLVSEAVRLARYARRLTATLADSDDLLQDTMLRCWKARCSFRPGSNFAGWTRTIMRNAFLSGRRRARFEADMPDDALDRMLTVAPTQGEAVDLRDVEWAIGELSPEQGDALRLAGQGFSIEQASTLLSIPSGTFKSRLCRARVRLKKLTEERTTPLRSEKTEHVRTKPHARRNWKGAMIG